MAKRKDKGPIFYVYELRLEGKEKPFYVGKGHGSRVYDRVRQVRNEKKPYNSPKTNTIRKALREGVKILETILVGGLEDPVALALEKEIIAKYGKWNSKTGEGLTNLTEGGEGASGCLRSRETRNKISRSKNNKSKKAKDDLSKLLSIRSVEFHAGMSEEDKAALYKKCSDSNRITYQNLSEEVKDRTSDLISLANIESWKNRSEDAKKDRSDRISEAQASRTDQDWADIRLKKKETVDGKTEDEKEATRRRNKFQIIKGKYRSKLESWFNQDLVHSVCWRYRTHGPLQDVFDDLDANVKEDMDVFRLSLRVKEDTSYEKLGWMERQAIIYDLRCKVIKYLESLRAKYRISEPYQVPSLDRYEGLCGIGYYAPLKEIYDTFVSEYESGTYVPQHVRPTKD